MEEALNYPYQSNESAYLEQYTRLCVDGDPQQVKERLDEISELYQTSDLSIVTICHGFEDRIRSYQLLAQACKIAEF